MDHPIIGLGLILAAAAVFAGVFKHFRQPTIVAFIMVGALTTILPSDLPKLDPKIISLFVEIGVILLLFIAGLEMDVQSLLRRWKLVIIVALGQIIITTILGMLISRTLIRLTDPVTLFFFAITMTLSSTIIVVDVLQQKKAGSTLHGQIILGLMVLQDVVALVSLSLLEAFSGGGDLGTSLAFIGLKTSIGVVLAIVLGRWVLPHAFRKLASSSETLFAGALGLAMGASALAELVHFSPEIAAFLAGAALALTPYRLEVADKVEPMKTFGIILFFISLGYGLELSVSMLNFLPQAIIFSAFILFGTPLLILILGWFARLRSQTSFMIGGVINQTSEFSLILAALAVEAKIFNQDILVLVTLTALITFLFSSMGHQVLEALYQLVSRPLRFIDRRSIDYKVDSEHGMEMDNHVIMLSFNEITNDVAEYYAKQNTKVLLIDIDPEITEHFKRQKGNIVSVYADPHDPDVWGEFGFDKAKIIISGLVEEQIGKVSIARWLREHGASTTFIASTASLEDAMELYEHGVDYVLETESLAAESFRQILSKQEREGKKGFQLLGKQHQQRIQELKNNLGRVFRLV